MSSINPNNIDGTYPIAGQDNDSQGFRDNFTNIKNNFTFAQTEINDLQNNAILKSALSGTTLDNNLNNAILRGAQLIRTTYTRNDLGTATGTVPVDWSTGHFQTLTTSGSVTLSFSNWITSGFYAELILEINVASTAHTLTLPAAVDVNNTNIKGIASNVITFNRTGKHLFEFSTYNAGSSITIRDLTRNYDTNTVDYQIFKPTGNVAITANVGIDTVLIAPTPNGGIVSFFADVTLPNTTTNGTTISISSNVAVNQFRALGPWLSTVSPSANVSLTAGSSVEYTYVSADNIWYKTR